MKLDSKYFDSVRMVRDHEKAAAREAAPMCAWKGCQSPGLYRAPRGRGQEGRFHLLCLDHIREFNASYNYFDGWSNAEVEAYQKNNATGHRTTWKVGANAWAHGTRTGAIHTGEGWRTANDPHSFFAWRSARGGEDSALDARRRLKPLELKALETLNLAVEAGRMEIKARFKELVKRHHPDANGGDKRSEDKLREIIQAYNYLKQAGLV
jgi:curved DNA-binding protein CbpA